MVGACHLKESVMGESKRIKFSLSPVDLAFYDVSYKDRKVEPGSYTIELAASSRDIRDSETIKREEGDALPAPDRYRAPEMI